MLESRMDLLAKVAEYFNQDAENFVFCDLVVSNSMSSSFEDGFNGSIFKLYNKLLDKYFVVKIKSSSFITNIGNAMNYTCSEIFKKEYNYGFRVFYIDDSYLREKFIYSMLDTSLKKYLPEYYGTIELDDEVCLHIIEYLEIRKEPLDCSQVLDFLVDLHCTYWQREDLVKSMKVNIPTAKDYLKSVLITDELLKNIAEFSLCVDYKILEFLRSFSKRTDRIYEYLCGFPRTLCQGDFNIRNISFSSDGIVSYDWELATFNNPTFDLVSFLVDYPSDITESFCMEFLAEYVRKMTERNPELKKLNWKESFYFNIILFMITRFHAQINIHQKNDLDFMPQAIKNWSFLFSVIPNDFLGQM